MRTNESKAVALYASLQAEGVSDLSKVDDVRVSGIHIPTDLSAKHAKNGVDIYLERAENYFFRVQKARDPEGIAWAASSLFDLSARGAGAVIHGVEKGVHAAVGGVEAGTDAALAATPSGVRNAAVGAWMLASQSPVVSGAARAVSAGAARTQSAVRSVASLGLKAVNYDTESLSNQVHEVSFVHEGRQVRHRVEVPDLPLQIWLHRLHVAPAIGGCFPIPGIGALTFGASALVAGAFASKALVSGDRKGAIAAAATAGKRAVTAAAIAAPGAKPLVAGDMVDASLAAAPYFLVVDPVCAAVAISESSRLEHVSGELDTKPTWERRAPAPEQKVSMSVRLGRALQHQIKEGAAAALSNSSLLHRAFAGMLFAREIDRKVGDTFPTPTPEAGKSQFAKIEKIETEDVTPREDDVAEQRTGSEGKGLE